MLLQAFSVCSLENKFINGFLLRFIKKKKEKQASRLKYLMIKKSNNGVIIFTRFLSCNFQSIYLQDVLFYFLIYAIQV